MELAAEVVMQTGLALLWGAAVLRSSEREGWLQPPAVIPDKAPSPKDWPRPESIVCRCGGTAWQREKGSTQYACVRCSSLTIHWTGFDDPAWC